MPRTNPFNPTAPIEPHYFAGRRSELQIVLSALHQTSSGSQQNVLITGERGIGKSSLALWGRFVAASPNVITKTNYQFASAYYTLDDKQTIADICQGVIDKLNAQLPKGLSDKFIERIRKLDLSVKVNLGIGVEIGGKRAKDPDAISIRADFVKYLEETWREISPLGYQGILLIVDELNKIDPKENLGAFFKKISEDLISDGFRNIMFFAVGLPWVEDKIFEDDSSATRIFSHVILGPMDEAESGEIIDKALDGTGVSLEQRAKETIISWAGGYPYFLQRMCFDCFEENTDNLIDNGDMIVGVTKSLDQFDRAFFGRVLRDFEGKNYQKIIETLSESNSNDGITATEIERDCKVRNVAQYLPRLQKDGIITSPKKGRHKLASPAFALYVSIEKSVGRWKKKAEST